MKIIKVISCDDCPYNGTCKAWKSLTRKQRVIMTISTSVPQGFILKNCHLEDEKGAGES